MYIVIPIEYKVEKTYNDSNNRLSISYINESNLNKDYYRQCPKYCVNEKTGFRISPISGFCFQI